ncbi:MAG: D-tyrosyl-tRNA(Tyr) deacylase [Chloroflexi bacterium]|nr:D-tyrosyl-tRNA(Tyr) deacylase [Chloroflexota bacterium]
MRAVVQRVTSASVTVDGQVTGAIDTGLLVLIGAGEGDREADAELLARKVAELRVFSDAAGKFNLSLLDLAGAALVVSQFTLYADLRKGRRPSFTGAAPPAAASALVDHFCVALRKHGVPVRTGVFGAHMDVRLVNDGPVTIVLDTMVWTQKS